MNISNAGQRMSSSNSHLSSANSLIQRAQCYLGLAILIVLDRILKIVLRPINFPAPLIGMALILTSLIIAKSYDVHRRPRNFFAPAVDWVAHKWLPCFYAPALVTLPLALAPLPPQSVVTAIIVIAGGVVLTCAFTSRIAIAIRAATGTEYQPPPPPQSHSSGGAHHGKDQAETISFSKFNYYSWGILAGVSTLILVFSPIKAETNPSATFILLLSSTILGYMGGMACPESVKSVIHPMLCTAALPNIVAAAVGLFTHQGYYSILQDYLTKGHPPAPHIASIVRNEIMQTADEITQNSGVRQNPNYVYLYGPGDVLFGFLGVIILSFGFKLFEEFNVLLRHRYEVLGSTFLSAGFSMLSTALLARLAGLPSELARAVVPRGATLALALPIAERLGASSQLTAAAVALTGLIGCNFVQALMTAFGANDPISRGITAAATAHGLGTAAMAAREPEGLPFAALSYALCGVSASILACIPPFRSILLWLTS